MRVQRGRAAINITLTQLPRHMHCARCSPLYVYLQLYAPQLLPRTATACDCLRLPATVYESNSSMRHAPRASSSIAQRAADATVPSAPPPAPCKSLAVRAGNAHELCHGRCLSRLTDAPRMPRPTSHELYPCCVGNASSAALLCV
jgi:hypothetical protein